MKKWFKNFVKELNEDENFGCCDKDKLIFCDLGGIGHREIIDFIIHQIDYEYYVSDYFEGDIFIIEFEDEGDYKNAIKLLNEDGIYPKNKKII